MSVDHNDIAKKLAILEEIASLISRSHELQDTLDQVCRLVTRQMGCDVCSIYLLDETGENLVLTATEGLDPDSIGKVQMHVDEGVTGLAVEEMKPIAVKNAAKHPRFKYFPETAEEQYTSLLSSPIIEQGRALGVINVQTREERVFSPEDLSVIGSIGTQVAVMVQNYRLLQAVTEHRLPLGPPSRAAEKQRGGEDGRQSIARGIPASPGIAMGTAVVIEQGDLMQLFGVKEFVEDAGAELATLDKAIVNVREEIKDAELRIAERLSDEEAKIFSTHLMILEDEGFLGKIREAIRVQKHSGLYAVRNVVAHYVQLFQEIDDPYIADKIADIEDVGKRLMNRLSEKVPDARGKKGERGILVASRIMPSDAIEMEARGMVALVSAEGGADSHASILARSFGFPSVVGLESQLRMIRDGDYLIVDGASGNVYVNPDKEVLKEFKRARRDYRAAREEIEGATKAEAKTRDGRRVRLMANVGIIADAKTARTYRADGIGLYRTEFLYITRPTFPTEEDQYKVYCQIIKNGPEDRVVFRTLDAGGDKYMPQLKGLIESNPVLGWRSIRVSLDLVHVFKTQLRAILRASVLGKTAIMFPMITNLEELDRAKALVEETKNELRRDGIAFDEKIEIGMMVEVPSAALLADKFAKKVDFFSVGTNDLTQYTLAVDRNNQRVAGLFDPLHPSVLHLIELTNKAARKAKIRVTLCGELGGYPEAIPMLVGMGFDAISVSPTSLPLVRYVIQALNAKDCEEVARKVLKCGTRKEVRAYLSEVLAGLDVPELDRLR